MCKCANIHEAESWLMGRCGRQPGGKKLFLNLVVKQLFEEEAKCYYIELDFVFVFFAV